MNNSKHDSDYIDHPLLNAIDSKMAQAARWVNDEKIHCLTQTLDQPIKDAVVYDLLEILQQNNEVYASQAIQEFSEAKLHKYRPYILNDRIHFSGGDHIGVYQKFISVSRVRDEGDMFALPTIDESVTEKRKLIDIKKVPTS